MLYGVRFFIPAQRPTLLLLAAVLEWGKWGFVQQIDILFTKNFILQNIENFLSQWHLYSNSFLKEVSKGVGEGEVDQSNLQLAQKGKRLRYSFFS